MDLQLKTAIKVRVKLIMNKQRMARTTWIANEIANGSSFEQAYKTWFDQAFASAWAEATSTSN